MNYIKLFIAILLTLNNIILPHGFGQNTFITLANGNYKTIDNLCNARFKQKSSPSILTYTLSSATYTCKKINAVGKSKTNCYFKINFDQYTTQSDIICTPDQEFYMPQFNEWRCAYTLKLGDELLSKNNTLKTITRLEFIEEPLDVYMIEIQNTHAFFVGYHSILTHNMLLPIQLCTALSIPISGISAGWIGSVLGPLGITGGVVIGSIIGTLVKILINDRTPQYKLPLYDICRINYCRNHDSNYLAIDTDAQAPGMPTGEDGFKPSKNWNGQKVKQKDGGSYGWPDNKGNVWVPSGPNGHGGPHWDVQHPKTGSHRNIFPGGKER